MDESHVYNTFEHIWFKHVFDLKFMNFEDVALTKFQFIFMC
jgi:hypothetical protein